MTLLSACGSVVAGRSAVADDPLTAPGFVRGSNAVDPLIVGDRLLAAGEAELALDSYVRAATGPQGLTPDIKAAMASANLSLGRLNQAENLLREVVEVEPRNAAAWNNLGVVLLERGRTGEANRTFKTAFALQPSPEILENLRVSDAKMTDSPYIDATDSAFTLTRRDNGVFDLTSPEQYP
ncbi:tetratricopeptide repeat protein [Jannaschia rubra]|nr:tetratricopeptide repeat protein [Jannaschia rubra]